MDLLIQILISGFIIGAIYALGAAGMTAIFGISGVLNLAHGAIVVLAAMVAWWLSLNTGLGIYLSAGLGVLAAIASGGIALCPETRELFSAMSVRENLELGGHALARDALQAQLQRVWTLFPKLRERARQSAQTLSGGEQQMLTIGRALMQEPSLLMLDEPTLGLAPLVLEDISRVLYTLQEDSGMTVLLAEQNMTFSLQHSDRMILLETGSQRWSGAAGDFAAQVEQDLL